MQNIETPASQPYTILRIKRKRHEEPLDALVVESRVRRKKSRGGISVFQFAKTVEDNAWQDEKQQNDIQEQISHLARVSSAQLESKPSNLPTYNHLASTQQKDDPRRRYTVLESHDTETRIRRRPTSPPKVIASKDLPLKNTNLDFKLYDAVLAAEKLRSTEVDDDMEKFLPMLNDYLKLHDAMPAPSQKPEITQSSSTSSSDDYVWDVFYHRPAALREWNEAANVGTLSGLPLSITDPYESASDSEEEDEADEDSNAEEYYKNDYPDEESLSDDSAGSDCFHEDSEHEWR